jgi:hypothetical protein
MTTVWIIPAQAEIQGAGTFAAFSLDSRLRGNDGTMPYSAFGIRTSAFILAHRYNVAMAPKTQDEEHLDVLAIFYYVIAGLNALGFCLTGIYGVVGIVMAVAGATQATGGERDGLMLIGGGITVFAFAMAIFIGVLSWLIYLAGRKLNKRQGRTYIMVIAAFMLLSVPFGTILGIFTLVILSRPSVVALFESHRDDPWRSAKTP